MERDVCRLIAEMLEGREDQFLDSMNEVLTDPEEDEEGYDEVEEFTSLRTSTFEERGMLCLNEGFTLRLSDGSEFQFQCVRSR